MAAALPAELKLRGRRKKAVLRDALRDWLPSDLLDRPKQGFSIPAARWFRGDLHAYAREILLDPSTRGRGYFRPAEVEALLDRHVAGSADESSRIWSLLVLEIWQREIADRITTPNVLSAA